MSDYKDLIARISDESGLCRNETATDIADLLDEARAAVLSLVAERDGLRDNRFVLNRALAIAAADLKSFGHHHAASAARAALRGDSDDKQETNRGE